MCFFKPLASTSVALGVFLCLAGPLSGEEGGAGDYPPGLYASLINITPNKPGFEIGTAYLFYTGTAGASATLPFGGILASNNSADVSLADLSLTYTFRPTILGAHYTVSLSIPYVWVDVEAKVSLNPRLLSSLITPRTKTVRDGAKDQRHFFRSLRTELDIRGFAGEPPNFHGRADGRLSERATGQSRQKSLDV